MPGTKDGAKKAVQTIRNKHGEDFFARIGAKGGAASGTGGFAYDGRTQLEKLLGKPKKGIVKARKAGSIGGKISKRREATR